MNWLDELSSSYYTKGTFKHASPKRIVLFPYTTSPVSQKMLEELSGFYSISGAAVRDLAGVTCSEECTSESVIEKIKLRVDTDHFNDLQHIVRTILYDEDDQLYCFHPIIFHYLAGQSTDKRAKAFGQFVRDVFFVDNKGLGPCLDYDKKSVNVLHSLVLQTLPELTPQPEAIGHKYYQGQDPVCDLFVKDCEFLTRDASLYSKNLPELIKFYFLIYQLRLVEDCNSPIGKSTREPFFFSVAWEGLSKGRQAYQSGWKRVDRKLFSMWAHANCLEMLNYLPVEGVKRPFAYEELHQWSKNASLTEKKQFLSSIDALIEFYREGVASLGFNWSRFEEDGNHAVEIEDKVRQFYKMVEVQFLHSPRKGAAERYSKWLREFATKNFLKQRGPLGNTLCLSREQLLFITRVCIGDRNEGKLRVTDLWVEFEKRGVCFDSDTKKHILDLYNKLNLIERKSDSGDAQYVRAIF